MFRFICRAAVADIRRPCGTGKPLNSPDSALVTAAQTSQSIRLSQPEHWGGRNISLLHRIISRHASPKSSRGTLGSVIMPHGDILPSHVTQNEAEPARQLSRSPHSGSNSRTEPGLRPSALALSSLSPNLRLCHSY